MLRIAKETDVPAILEIYAPYVTDTTITFEYNVPTEAEFLQRFREITEEFPWLVWEEQGKILGYAYACRPFQRTAYRWCAEPSIYLIPAARGNGIGRKLYTGLETLLKDMGYRMLFALITGENKESVAFHEKLGYTVAGRLSAAGYKLGRWCDVIWMEKQLQIVDNPMDFPAKWATIRQFKQKICDILYSLSLS